MMVHITKVIRKGGLMSGQGPFPGLDRIKRSWLVSLMAGWIWWDFLLEKGVRVRLLLEGRRW